MKEPKLCIALHQCVYQDNSKTANGCVEELQQILVVFFLYSNLCCFR
jgi:hypothetical protein